jgi:hypothetical protein
MWKIAAFSLIFGACAGSTRDKSPPLASPETPKILQPAPLASLTETRDEGRRIEERSAQLKEEVEPKGVKALREVLSPNASDQRLGVPNYAMRFTRAIGSTPP